MLNADAGPPGGVVLLLLGVVVVHSHMQENTSAKVHRMQNTHELTTRGGSNSAGTHAVRIRFQWGSFACIGYLG